MGKFLTKTNNENYIKQKNLTQFFSPVSRNSITNSYISSSKSNKLKQRPSIADFMKNK